MKLSKFNNYKKIVNVPIKKYRFNPDKKVSKGQKILQDFILKYINPDYILQECYIPGSKKRLDLVLIHKKVIIEYSPVSHHGTYNEFFHKNRLGFLKSIKADFNKQEWAEANGFKWVEIKEEDLENLSYEFFVESFELYL